LPFAELQRPDSQTLRLHFGTRFLRIVQIALVLQKHLTILLPTPVGKKQQQETIYSTCRPRVYH
jgi:hypothetical protein